jgi:hypothetical protein
LAVTRTSTVPKNPFAHVITHVTGSMLPADGLLGPSDQLNPELLLAVVE